MITKPWANLELLNQSPFASITNYREFTIISPLGAKDLSSSSLIQWSLPQSSPERQGRMTQNFAPFNWSVTIKWPYTYSSKPILFLQYLFTQNHSALYSISKILLGQNSWLTAGCEGQTWISLEKIYTKDLHAYVIWTLKVQNFGVTGWWVYHVCIKTKLPHKINPPKS